TAVIRRNTIVQRPGDLNDRHYSFTNYRSVNYIQISITAALVASQQFKGASDIATYTMVRPNCGLCSEPVQREQPSISSCQIKLIPNNTDDKLNRILNELQCIKSQQIKSDELLSGISLTMYALSDKVVQQRKNISALGHSVNSFGNQLNTDSNEVKSQGQLIGGLETRILAVEKTLSNITVSSSTTETTPSLNDIAREVQLRTLLAVNLIIRDSILRAYRIGKTADNKPRLLKIVLSSRAAVDSVVTTFPKLQINPPDHLRPVSITRDRTQSERQYERSIKNLVPGEKEENPISRSDTTMEFLRLYQLLSTQKMEIASNVQHSKNLKAFTSPALDQKLDRNPNNSSFSRGGGVLIAIKSSLKSHPVPLNVSNVEQVYAVMSINTNNFLVGCVNLPPVAPLIIVESHLSSVENVISNLKPHSVILCGDFNIPHINWSSDLLGLSASGDFNPVSHAIVDSFSFLNFFQLNSISNNQGNTLDLIFSNSNKVTVCLATEPLWYVPNKTFHSPKFPHWTSPDLRNLILHKKRAHAVYKRSNSAANYSSFSELRAKCKRLSKIDYQSYISSSEKMLLHNPSAFWKFTKELNQNNTIPCTLSLDNETEDSPTDSANLFSKYFSSVFRTAQFSFTDFPQDNIYPYDLPSNCYFTPDDVLAVLYPLKNNFSNGPDGISGRLLFNCRDSIAFPLFMLFRRSLDEGIFPVAWKTCSVSPVLKFGDPSLVSNYRPISILPHIAKLFESIIYSCVKRSLNHIIIDDQHGFRPGKSTVTNSLVFTSYILESFESGCQVDIVFIHFEKAFDTVDHCRLITELARLGIGNPLLSWLQSYLNSRTQYVKDHGAFSNLSTISSGVPQGGHLSPHLFILFTNTIHNYLSTSKILLFAVDIKIYLKISSPLDCFQLQSDLDSFCKWTQRLGLILNLNKCHFMSFSRKRVSLMHPYFLNGFPLKRVFEVKDLGFYLTPTLSFENHMIITIGRALKVLGFIKRNTRLFTSIPCLSSLYFSLVRSTLEYGIVVWQPYLARDRLRIERVQNRFLAYAAYVLNISHPLHDYSTIKSSLNVSTLSFRRFNADINFISALLNCSIDASDLLSSISFRIPIYPTRNHSLYYVLSHRTNYNHNHPIHRMLRLLNTI
ncbi:Uncharacterized protein FWK35_00034356, partial [Aphis craccivora]